MAVKVKTPYWRNFNLPGACAVCGHPAGAGTTWKVSGSKSNWSGKQTTTLNLELPLCQTCFDVSRDSTLGKAVGCLGIVMAIGACLVTAGVVGSGSIDNPILGVTVGAFMMLVIGGLAVWVMNLIHTRDLTPEQIKRRSVVKKCARITGFKAPGLFDKQGWIQFEFQNPAFANEFARLNMGQMA